MARTATISWRPNPDNWAAVSISTKALHDVLEKITKYAFGEHQLEEKDIPFLEGAVAAGCTPAAELIAAIREHKSIRVKRGPFSFDDE